MASSSSSSEEIRIHCASSSPQVLRNSRGRNGRSLGRSFRGRYFSRKSGRPVVLEGLDLGSYISSIKRDVRIENKSPRITNSKYIASYNWVNQSKPTILVPGCPPAWTPPVEDYQLSGDDGKYFRDINAAKFPSYPLEPTVRAIFVQEPSFSFSSIDLVGCNSTLLKIWAFVREEQVAFTIDVQCIGNVVLLTRRDGEPTKLIEDVYGYGHTFPEAYTSWNADTSDSISHQRIIKYDFGGIQVVLRAESDGYMKENTSIPPKKTAVSIEDALELFKVSKQALASDQGEELVVRKEGMVIPQKRIFDIKTRSRRSLIDEEEFLPRLWISSTSHFLLARHLAGLFDAPKIRDMQAEISAFEDKNRDTLARFHGILSRILSFARDSGTDSSFVISWDGIENELKITKPLKEKEALPKELGEKIRSTL